ncbi:MAG: hypothetical protein ACLQNE_41990 [Thermoguttaceae bacterium]
MNTTHTLTFLWTPWSAFASVLLGLAAAGLCFAAWRRSGYQASMGLLELLRFVLVVLAALLLNQPEFVQEFRPKEKPSIAVLWDASPSMDTRDAASDDPAAAAPVSRRQAIAALTDASFWKELDERFDVVVQPFSGPTGGGSTELYGPLATAPAKYKNLVGVVLVSDGDWNAGLPPVEAATLLRLGGVPVLAVPVGKPVRLPDVELRSLDAPTFAVLGKSLRIPFTVESSMPRDYAATIVLRTSGGDEVSKEVCIAAMGVTHDWVVWKPTALGDVTLTLEVPPHRDETLTDNNRLSVPISVRQEKLRVLVVESYPRWEYRYLRNALSRDPGVDLSCLLFHPGLSKPGGGNKDYIKQFPAGLDELSRFDVVFLGDVGLGNGQLTVEQCGWLKGLVEHQASGIVFMPGSRGLELSLQKTELDALCPVVLDETKPDGWGSSTPCHFVLTELGRCSLLTKLADSEEENTEVWEGLPGFQWYAPVLRARAGVEVLAVHKDVENKFGRMPLLVTRTYGAGKALFMGTDGAWRWRRGVEDKYHYRFWGQVVRWMAYRRNMAKGEMMRLYYSPDQPQIDGTLTLSANVMNRSGEPLQGGDVTARITTPSGKAETIGFMSSGDPWGAYSAQFTAREPGKHPIVLTCKQTGATLEASFFVQGAVTERIGRPARPEVLEEIARVTRGKVMRVDRPDEIVSSLASLPDPAPSARRVQLWNHPVMAGLLIALLGVFWVGRKTIGLI